jgi:DNA-binding transcriptional LysR family regulator
VHDRPMASNNLEPFICVERSKFGKVPYQGAGPAARGEIGRLRFGFTGLTSYAGMPELVQRFKRRHPDVASDLIHTAMTDLEIALLKDEIDTSAADLLLVHSRSSSDPASPSVR